MNLKLWHVILILILLLGGYVAWQGGWLGYLVDKIPTAPPVAGATLTPTSTGTPAPTATPKVRYVQETVEVPVTKVVEVTKVIEVTATPELTATPTMTETVEAELAAKDGRPSPTPGPLYSYVPGGDAYALETQDAGGGCERIVTYTNEDNGPRTFLICNLKVSGDARIQWSHPVYAVIAGKGVVEFDLKRDLAASATIDPDPYDVAASGVPGGLAWFFLGGDGTWDVNGMTAKLRQIGAEQLPFPFKWDGTSHFKFTLNSDNSYVNFWQGERDTAKDTIPLPEPVARAAPTAASTPTLDPPAAEPSAVDPGAGEVKDGVEYLPDRWRRLREAGGDYCAWSSQHKTSDGLDINWQQCVKGVVSGSGTLALRPDPIGYGQSDTRGTGLSFWVGGGGEVRVDGGDWISLTPTVKIDFPKDGGEVVLEFRDANADFWLGEN